MSISHIIQSQLSCFLKFFQIALYLQSSSVKLHLLVAAWSAVAAAFSFNLFSQVQTRTNYCLDCLKKFSHILISSLYLEDLSACSNIPVILIRELA